MRVPRIALILAVLFAVCGCSQLRAITGYGPAGDPSVTLKSAETRWLLVKNPRFGDVASEPEYTWVEEDKVPFSFKGMFSKRSVIAPPEVVSQYGAPPGGGKISSRQGLSYQATVLGPAAPPANAKSAANPREVKAVSAPVDTAKQGYVVWADTTRVAIDLTASDGVRPGSVVSLRRDRIPIVHPITGEVLGDLDEEIATARITEIREKFSVAEIQTLAPGAHVQVKDRVVLK